MKALVAPEAFSHGDSATSRRLVARLMGISPAALLLTGLMAVWAGPLAAPAAAAAATSPVVAWGDDSVGQSTVPSGLSGVTAIAAGWGHNLALNSNGTVVAWGWNDDGQSTVPFGLTGVTAISAGAYHSVALKSDGTVVAWGRNNHGQTTVPGSLSGVTAISAGADHNVALKSDGTVVAWGWNDDGQSDVPAGLAGVTAIAAGWYHNLALKSDGTVVAWGQNTHYQAPATISLTGISGIAAGGFHSLALRSNGTVVGWGWNTYGQALVPGGLTGVSAIAAGAYHSLALKSNGTVVAWGLDDFGEGTVPAGITNVTAISAGGFHNLVLTAPVPPPAAWGRNLNGQSTVPAGLTGAKGLAAGGYHSLALKADGTVVGWGRASEGQITMPPGLSGITMVAAGGYHSLALRSDGTVAAWGRASEGQITMPPGLSGVTAIAAGNLHSLALKSDGTVAAWGWNGDGQTDVPADLTGVIAIAAGANHSLALKSDGTVVAWGNSLYGQATVPDHLSGVTAIAAGYLHSLALKSDGTMVAWGDSHYAQTAVPVGLSGVTAIAAGWYHSVALYTDGVASWGLNEDGQDDPPADVAGVTVISAGGYHNLVLEPSAVTSLTAAGLDSPRIAGAAGSVVVTARDAYGNTSTGYTGTVHLTSSDGAATLGADRTLIAGVRTFSVTLRTVGTQSVTATDTVTSSITGSQSGIVVVAPPTAPGKPTGVTATAGNASAAVSWTPPASNGGSSINGYRVTSSPDGKTCTSGPGATICTVLGLTNGQPYTFTVHATNGVGDGPESDPSASVTPAAPRTGATYHAVTPNRVLDTRNGTGGLSGPFTNHVARTFTIGGVPAGAIAVTGNLTVTGQTSSGYLFIGPVATNNPGSSTLNFPVGDDRANAVTVALGTGGTLSITFVAPSSGPTAHAIFDVTGYFTSDTSGATYHALSPTRALDTRNGTGGLSGPFTNHAARTFTVGGVPPNAIAVTGNLTVTGQTSSGYFSIGPVATDNPGSSTLNFPVGDDRANAVTVALGTGGTLSITFVAPSSGPTAHAIFDVTGYFTPDMNGATYVPLTPNRVLDTRDGTGGLAGPFTNHAARTFTVGGVPSTAIAVTGNLTVTGQTSSGYLFIGPVATDNPGSSTLNFPVGDDRANAVTVALGTGGTLSITFVAPSSGPTAQAIFDVTGYFTP